MGSHFSPGSLVRARGRDWFVLDGSTDELLLLRSLGVGDDIGMLQGEGALEKIELAHFAPPDPRRLGQPASVLLLREAFRLARRAPAGPLRSLTSVELVPHPYQLVPLLMALRQPVARLLIADDVGTGKTIEAAIIARELIERGIIKDFSVLCPPQLAQQWVDTLSDLFHLPAVAVLSGSAARLERQCEPGQSLFERFPYTVISTDYIKQPTRRAGFMKHAPQLIIVDEAHTCADAGDGSAAQQRHALLRDLAGDPADAPARHLLLLTATPHSGDTAAFNSLLSLLNHKLNTLPERWQAAERKRVAPYIIQRRRAELVHYLEANTAFPTRHAQETHYTLSRAYREVFDETLSLCRSLISDDQSRPGAARMRWWSALALLRSVSSSPAAGVATLSNRALLDDDADTDAINARGARAVLDRDDDSAESIDLPPSLTSELASSWSGLSVKLKALHGKARDAKLKAALDLARGLISRGRNPIFFCRFLDTATYLGDQLTRELGASVHVEIITGQLPPEERQTRIKSLEDKPTRVLVTTDCLSEGINLQHLFDAVVHYDMAWNPTRHEQREGRVDRFGQPKPTVETITLIGKDNPIDDIIFKVLIKKHLSIRNALGVAIPIPAARHVEEAILEGLLLRDKRVNTEQLALDFMADLPAIVKDLHTAWDQSAEAHKRRAHFTHEDLHEQLRATLPPLLRQLTEALGDRADVARLLDLCELLGHPAAVTRDPLPSRADASVTSLARALLDDALDDKQTSSAAARAGCAFDAAVAAPTALYLVRMRLTALAQGGGVNRYAEELVPLALPLEGHHPVISGGPQLDALLAASPQGGPPYPLAQQWVQRALDAWNERMKALKDASYAHADALTALHNTMRDVEGITRDELFDIFEPLDLLGVLVFLPVGGAR
jgi:superfamily II DNA or RNA helicase